MTECSEAFWVSCESDPNQKPVTVGQADPPAWTTPAVTGTKPSSRLQGHSAVLDTSGKMWIFGGRGSDGTPWALYA